MDHFEYNNEGTLDMTSLMGDPVFVAFISNVYQDHNVTGVELTYESILGSGKIHGSAMRNPMDRHNGEMAMQIAVNRALGALARRFDKRTRGLIKHQDDMLTSAKQLKQNTLKDYAKGFDKVNKAAKKANKKAKA